MVIRRLLVLLVVLGIVAASCGDSISADTCDELVDETIDMMQRLIDDVDANAGDISLDDFIASDGELPSLERFQEESARIDDLAVELGCSNAELKADVTARADDLRAESELGQFIIRAVRTGGI